VSSLTFFAISVSTTLPEKLMETEAKAASFFIRQ
jgi:hypothetical protein